MKISSSALLLRVWPVDQKAGITLLGLVEMPSLGAYPSKADELEAVF